MADMCVSRAEFDKVKAEHGELKRDAAIWRSLIVLGETGVAALGVGAAATGNFGPLGSTTDSLARAGTLVGSIAVGADAFRRGKSIVGMLSE